MTQMITRTV